jgi:alkylhydroperoxidase/carboxymuconolactone decarboxylase family protein YurZ
VKTDELLRRLALNDEKAVHAAVASWPLAVGADPRPLDAKTAALVRLAALLSVGAATVSCRASVEVARAAGASDEDMVAVLVAVAPAVGAARLVASAPRLALAIDCDVEGLAEGLT